MRSAGTGLCCESYDLILALDVIHATPDIGQSAAWLRTLLVPGGVLALVETTHSDPWTNMIWGVMEGWWLFADAARTDSPLLPLDQWRKVLPGLGFGTAHIFPEVEAGLNSALLLLERAASSASSLVPKRQPHMKDWFSTPSWERYSHPSPAAVAPGACWLVFVDAAGVTDAIIAALRQAGATVTEVRAGAEFRRVDLERYHMPVADSSAYLSLFGGAPG